MRRWLLALTLMWAIAGMFCAVATHSPSHPRLLASSTTAASSNGTNYGGNDPNG